MVNDRHGPQALHYAHVATWTGTLRFASPILAAYRRMMATLLATAIPREFNASK